MIFLKPTLKRQKTDFKYKKSVRNLVLFSNHNLLSNPPFLNQDLISCRNLLIYFDASLQKKVIPLFHYALNEHGLLILGKSETVGHFNNLFTTIDGKNKLYKRKYSSVNNHPLNFSTYSNNFIRKRENDAHSIDTEKLTIEDKVKETLYNTYEHPFVVVDNNLEIIEEMVNMVLTKSPVIK
jgi:two-component system CheB/CheR fusion protein